MKDLESRLLDLERSNRRLKTTLLALIGALLMVALFGFTQDPVQQVVKAKSFQVIGENGKVLAAMEVYSGSGNVTTYNADGKILVDVVATKSGAGGIVSYDGKGNQNLVVTDVTGGGGSILLNNSSFKKVLELSHNDAGGGAITLYNDSGIRTGLLTTDTEHSGAILTYDKSGTQTARMPN